MHGRDASDLDNPPRVPRSRVVLIDIPFQAPDATSYIDLTSVVEDSATARAARGDYDGSFAMCSAVKS